MSAALALASVLFPCAAFASKRKPDPAPSPVVHSSQPPICTIPADPLGFAAPGEFYMGIRNAMASLDFLDEDHLLFTFRVPGLYRRDPNGEPSEVERHIRAVVLHIPDGAVQAEALWTLHDRSRYLYMLDNGQFLLRDRDTIQQGDASLQLTPALRFPGQLLRVELDPSNQYLVTNSRESESTQHKAGTVSSSASATADGPDEQTEMKPPDMVLRVLKRSSGQVLLTSHERTLVHLPMNADGYLEPLRASGTQWAVNLNYFTGGSTRVGAVDSVCVPDFSFLSPSEFLVSTCTVSGDPAIVAMMVDGRRLWQASGSATTIWPVFLHSRNGARLAVETLRATHAVSAMTPLGSDDIVSQNVMVFDAATGNVALKAQASPILDAGGNAALSPSGRRAAVLMDGGIQVFDLPAAPAVPVVSSAH